MSSLDLHRAEFSGTNRVRMVSAKDQSQGFNYMGENLQVRNIWNVLLRFGFQRLFREDKFVPYSFDIGANQPSEVYTAES